MSNDGVGPVCFGIRNQNRDFFFYCLAVAGMLSVVILPSSGVSKTLQPSIRCILACQSHVD